MTALSPGARSGKPEVTISSPADAVFADPQPADDPSRLIAYALRGLRRCWMPERGRYSHSYRLDGPDPVNQSVPESDAFYTLNVLLGFSRLSPERRRGLPDLRQVYENCCREAANPRFRTYACGMALWAGAELGIAPPVAVVDRVLAVALDRRALDRLTAQDVGMLVSGTTALALAEGGVWRPVTETLVEHLIQRFYNPTTGLFYNQATGLRRRFASFASQVYPMLALYHYGEGLGAEWAIRAANSAAAELIARQGSRGEWPWFYSVPSGRVVDFYEVYSVHQHGIAPAFLHHAITHGVDGARDALVRGFGWLFGDNAMGISMLRPKEGMFYRSQVRSGELDTSWPRARRSFGNALLPRDDTVESRTGLMLRAECRSYELGWILWSFGGRSDYPELTQRSEFSSALTIAATS
jgi:hypothetical protein